MSEGMLSLDELMQRISEVKLWRGDPKEAHEDYDDLVQEVFIAITGYAWGEDETREACMAMRILHRDPDMRWVW
jgi:DNA-directed RNA polymerase specialized sigma24 family protein